MDQYLAGVWVTAAGTGLIGFIIGAWLGNRTGKQHGAEGMRKEIVRHHLTVIMEQVKLDREWTQQTRYWYRRLVKPIKLEGSQLKMNMDQYSDVAHGKDYTDAN